MNHSNERRQNSSAPPDMCMRSDDVDLSPNASESLDPFMTRQELARRWKCSRKKLDNDFCSGRLPIATICIGRLRRHKREEILAYERLVTRRSSSDVGGKNG